MKYLSFFKQTDEVYEGHDTYEDMNQHSLGINNGHTLSSPGKYITMDECQLCASATIYSERSELDTLDECTRVLII